LFKGGHIKRGRDQTGFQIQSWLGKRACLLLKASSEGYREKEAGSLGTIQMVDIGNETRE
jgi:hypothetical protein